MTHHFLTWARVPALAISCVLSLTQVMHAEPFAGRLVSIGGSVTEIVHALGMQDQLIARDTTSSWPEAVNALPDVGYMRALSPEGVLSVSPDLIIAEEGSGPPETIALLEEANVQFVTIPDGFDQDAVGTKIRAVAIALGVPEKGEALAVEIDAQLTAAQETATNAAPKRVMFILSTEGGRIMASGTNTAADGIITMAGGVNAVTGFEGYKLLTDEAVAIAAPDVVLMMDRGGDHAASDADLWALPALATTMAAHSQSVVRINGLLLLGFGPRTAEAVTRLNQSLYPEG